MSALDSFGYPCCGASPTTAAVNECLPAFVHQPATPRLDGAFLAECFRSPRLTAAHNLAFQNTTNQSVASHNLVSQNLPSQNLLSQNLPSQNSPNASMASTAHCYTSSSSPRLPCDGCLPTTKAEPLQHSHMTHAVETSPLGAPFGDVLGETPRHRTHVQSVPVSCCSCVVHNQMQQWKEYRSLCCYASFVALDSFKTWDCFYTGTTPCYGVCSC